MIKGPGVSWPRVYWPRGYDSDRSEQGAPQQVDGVVSDANSDSEIVAEALQWLHESHRIAVRQ